MRWREPHSVLPSLALVSLVRDRDALHHHVSSPHVVGSAKLLGSNGPEQSTLCVLRLRMPTRSPRQHHHAAWTAPGLPWVLPAA